MSTEVDTTTEVKSFKPSSSNPILSIARHFDVDLAHTYNAADFMLRVYGSFKVTPTPHHKASKIYFSLLDDNKSRTVLGYVADVISKRLLP